MRYVLALLFVVFQIVASNGAVNYCGARMCAHTDGHTFCKYQPGPSASCVGYMEARLSAEEKTRVLARLNRRRSEVALGWRHWPPAGNMLKLRWIEELSREAQRWADQCRPPRHLEERDLCRDLYSISVGQCVASVVGEAPGLRPESMVDMWFMQSMSYEGNVTSYIPASTKNDYGDFAQMMWSRTYLVGCGRSRFMAQWNGRLRSVERLVCNFAPRGPVPYRPLWSPADAASMCPPRSQPDILPGLCTYQYFEGSRNFNDSLSIQASHVLEAIFEIEKNKSLDYLGSLDERYLTKMAIATVGTTMPMIPLYYSFKQNDIVEQNENGDEFWKIDNRSEIIHNSIETHQLAITEKPVLRTKLNKVKVNTIGRPKPYDMNELNDATWELQHKNFNNIEDLKPGNEIDIYKEYGLVGADDDNTVNTTELVFTITNHYDSTSYTGEKSEKNALTNVINGTDSMVGSENYFDNINGSVNINKTVDDYLEDPETVRALQDALDQLERTLASPGPVSTPGKVRRELRNLDADLQKLSTGEVLAAAATPDTLSSAEAMKEEERNKSRDRGPMLSMVLKYMPYLKPYESSIVGPARGRSAGVRCVVAALLCPLLMYGLVL